MLFKTIYWNTNLGRWFVIEVDASTSQPERRRSVDAFIFPDEDPGDGRTDRAPEPRSAKSFGEVAGGQSFCPQNRSDTGVRQTRTEVTLEAVGEPGV